MNACTTAELQRRRLLEGPILVTLLTMAWPTLLQMLTFSAVLLLETWFIGKMGVVALAGASLVSPANFLMQAMAAGGMGSAVTAKIAAAAGSGDRQRVQSLAAHAIAIALACGVAFSVAMSLCGPAFYRLMGGSGAALDAALAYSNALFLAAPLMWLVIMLAAILRGLGVVKLQAIVTVCASVLLLPLSPLLIFGAGPIPALGMRGAAISVLCYYALVAALYVRYLRSPASVIAIHWNDTTFTCADFASILRLGGISSLLAVQSHLTTLIVTGLVGGFGIATLAGFGAAARLQQIVDPFLFSVGTATVVMVATCAGAGDAGRARKTAWTAACAAAVFCGSIGGLAAFFPQHWIALFSDDSAVVAAGALYLRAIGPFYWCVGLGLILYYCSQGIGRMHWSYAGSLLRLAIIAAAGGSASHTLRTDAAALYRVVAAAMVLSCAVTVIGIACNDWIAGPPRRRAME